MFLPLVHVTLPPLEEGNSAERHFAPLVFMLEGLINLNLWHLSQSFRRVRAGLEAAPIPPLHASGAFYAEDPPGQENWRDIPAALDRVRSGKGIDCDNIIAWRTAELRFAGIAADPVIKWQHLPHETAVRLGYPAKFVPLEGLWLVHCCVRWPNGAIEDTSKDLGMGGNFTSKA
jgi:hypothetical protein